MKLGALALRIVAGIFVVVGGVAACSEDAVTVGSGTEPEPDAGALPDASTSMEVWSGYLKDFTFNSGSDRITVTLTSPTSGTVVFGEGPAVNAPPVDPQLPYPPGYHAERGASMAEHPGRWTEHFAFTLRDVNRESDRLRFAFSFGEMWQQWCKGQTLITIEGWWGSGQPSGYSCAGVAPGKGGECRAVVLLPDGGPPFILPDDGGLPMPPTANDPVDCTLRGLCGVCACTATGCDGAESFGSHFDLHISGREASGDGDLGAVYLNRQ